VNARTDQDAVAEVVPTRGHSLDWNIVDHRLHVWRIKFHT